MIEFDFKQDHILTGLWDSKIFANVPISHDRTTTTYELELVLENGGTSVINGKKYPIRKYNFHCVPPNTIRHTEFPFKCLYIKFRTESNRMVNLLASLKECFPLSDGEKIHELYNELLTLYHVKDSELLVCAKFTELLYLLQNESIMSDRKALFMVEEAKAFMIKHLAEKLTLQDIATAVHFNPIYFHRVFKRETGMTPLDYFTEERIEKAKNDLRTTDSSISQIANDCGFSSLAYFGSVFKKRTGYTPLMFRKTHGYQYLSDGVYPDAHS